MRRIFDHVDLRVRDLAAAESFYRELLPALGFSVRVAIPGWLQFEAPGEGGGPTEFFGLTDDPAHVRNASRIAFWAETPVKVDALAEVARRAGAVDIEGPGWEAPGYYAVYFNDPSGNALEVCWRERAFGANAQPG